MTDSNMESGQQVGGARGTPGSDASQAAGTQPSAIDVKALAEALRPIVAEEVERRGQSVKDKRIAKIQATQDELLARYDNLLKEGLSPARARRELLIDHVLEQQLGREDEPVSPAKAGTHQQVASPDTTAWLKSVGLTDTDPDVVAAYRDHGDEPGQLAQQLLNITAKRQQVQQRPANPAQVLSGGGGVTVSGVSKQSLQAEYDALNKTIPRGEYAIKARGQLKDAIRKKARDAGVESPV